MFDAGDVVTVDFPGVTGIKRRPALILSSVTYHKVRPDIIVGLITTQTTGLGITDYLLQDWEEAGLRVSSAFRCFIATLPRSSNPVLIGHLSERDWEEVLTCLKKSLANFDISQKSND